VLDAPADVVASNLSRAGVPAATDDVPATLEEVFVELTQREAA
jgi:hypothetical protein